MNSGVRLGTIPKGKYSDYRLDVIFSAYKWDPQVGDCNTVSHNVVLLSKDTASKLEAWAEELSKETVLMENALFKNLSLAKDLGIPKENLKAYKNAEYNQNDNVRLMRFDFHPTAEGGWAISEVNSDVPGGLAEASVLPKIAAHFFDGYEAGKNTASYLFKAFKAKSKKAEVCNTVNAAKNSAGNHADNITDSSTGDTIDNSINNAAGNAVISNAPVAFVHATAYSDDRQVMQFLSDYFEENGINTVFAAPDHIKWIDGKAHCIAQGCEGELGGIVRFYPLEWLPLLPSKSGWKGFYSSVTPACNHPVALLTQSKRLPLIWDKLNIDLPAWKSLLPQTIDTKSAKGKDGFIFKPAFGRVGEGISIKEAVSKKEYAKNVKIALKYGKYWVAQQKFNSLPLFDDFDGQFFEDEIVNISINRTDIAAHFCDSDSEKSVLGATGTQKNLSEPDSSKINPQFRPIFKQSDYNCQIPKNINNHIVDKHAVPKHLCIGVFTVDGKSAGFYGRISNIPRIDHRAEDIPVLISKE